MKKSRILILVFILIAISSFSQLDTRNIIYKGRYDIYNKQYHDAIKKFNSVITVKPELVEPYFYRGIAKYELKDYKGAELDLLKVIDMNSFYISAYHYVGIVYGSMSDYNLAIKYLDKAIDLSPYDASILLSRGITRLQMKDTESAIEDFNKAIKLNNQLPELYLNKGVAYMVKDDYESAIVQFNKAIKLNVFYADAYARRGLANLELKKTDLAKKDLSHAIKLDSKNSVYYYWRAHLYYENMEFDNAIADYDKVLSINPNNALVFFNRAIIKADIGLYNEAIEDYNKVIELNPENIIPYYNKATIRINNKEYGKAIDDLTAAINVFGEFSQAYEMRSFAKRKIGDERGAWIDSRTAEKISKEYGASNIDTSNFKKLIEFEDDFYSTKPREKNVNAFGNIVFSIVKKTQQQNKHLTKYYYDFLEDVNSLITNDYKIVLKIEGNNISDSDLVSLNNEMKDVPIDKDSYIYFIRAVIEKELKNYNQAAENLALLLESNKDFIPAKISIANIIYKKLDYENNVSDYNIRVEIDGMNSEYKTKSGEEHYMSVVDAYSKVSNKNEIVDFNLGNLYSEINQHFTAIYYYSKAIDENADLSYAYFNRGMSNIKINQNKKACFDFSKAGELGVSKAYNLIEKYCKNIDGE